MKYGFLFLLLALAMATAAARGGQSFFLTGFQSQVCPTHESVRGRKLAVSY